MAAFSRFSALILAGICLCVFGCTFPVRTGYDRKTGAYKPAPAATQTANAASTASTGTDAKQPQTYRGLQNTTVKQTSAGNAKQAAAYKMAQENAPRQASNSSLEQLAKSWIGTPYVYGGSSKSGTDCSGYVMQIYKAHYGISLPHNAGQMYDDSRGSSVSRGSLQEGDRLVALAYSERIGETVAKDSVYYLTVSNDVQSGIRFAIERDGVLIATTDEQMTYRANAVIGSPDQPVVISFRAKGIEDGNSTEADCGCGSKGWFTVLGVQLQHALGFHVVVARRLSMTRREALQTIVTSTQFSGSPFSRTFQTPRSGDGILTK